MTNPALPAKFIMLLLICFVTQSQAQKKEDQSTLKSMTAIHIGYGYTVPGGDLDERFGNTLKFSLGYEKNTFNNFVYGVDFDFGFGKEVNEDPLAPYRTDNEVVIGIDGLATDLFLRSRQLYLGVLFGKVFTKRPSQKSGLRLAAGAGLLNHYIRFNDEVNTAGQVAGIYGIGHDRLTRGFALKQQLGWELHSKDERLNLSIDFEITEGFTKQIREFNFDTMQQVTGRRLDLIYALKVNWMIPLFKSTSSKEAIYY